MGCSRRQGSRLREIVAPALAVTLTATPVAAAPSQPRAAGAAAVTPAAAPPGKPTPPDGSGLVMSGGLLIGVGGFLALGGAINLVRAGRESEAEAAYGAGLRGTACLGASGVVGVAGVSLLIVGLVRRRAWRAWQAEHRVALRPSFGRSPRATWMAGVELRF